MRRRRGKSTRCRFRGVAPRGQLLLGNCWERRAMLPYRRRKSLVVHSWNSYREGATRQDGGGEARSPSCRTLQPKLNDEHKMLGPNLIVTDGLLSYLDVFCFVCDAVTTGPLRGASSNHPRTVAKCKEPEKLYAPWIRAGYPCLP